MKKDELLSFGIPAEKIKEFQPLYWADVKKQAVKMAEKERETVVSPASIREAITAMLRLIDDEKRLITILGNINRHFAQYTEEKREKGSRSNLPPVPLTPPEESEGAQNVPQN